MYVHLCMQLIQGLTTWHWPYILTDRAQKYHCIKKRKKMHLHRLNSIKSICQEGCCCAVLPGNICWQRLLFCQHTHRHTSTINTQAHKHMHKKAFIIWHAGHLVLWRLNFRYLNIWNLASILICTFLKIFSISLFFTFKIYRTGW